MLNKQFAARMIEDPPPIATVQQQQAEQMKMYWKVSHITKYGFRFCSHIIAQFVEGMLTSLGPLPLDRIQTMLNLAPGYDRSIEQLMAFMEAARREGLVSGKDGIWRLQR